MSHKEIHKICKKYNITNYSINDDMSIDVDNDVDLSYSDLHKLPLNFNKVNGDFDCSCNNLESLEGSPSEVGGDFDCGYNHLESLEFSPSAIGGDYYCYDNSLKTLKGAPNKIGGIEFNCNINKLVSLKHAPCNIEKFRCFFNSKGLDYDKYNKSIIRKNKINRLMEDN